MGQLVNYMQELAVEFNSAGGMVSRKRLAEWFGNRVAVKCEGDGKDVVSDNKIAKIVVGVSGIGKTSYVRNFIANHPDFVLISSDDAIYQQMDEINSGNPTNDNRVVEILEEKIHEAKDKNVIIDALCIHPAYRAGMISFLRGLGYEIHIIYFSREYTEANIDKCFVNRAIELALYQEYLTSHDTQKMKVVDIMKIRDDILSIYAKKRGVSIKELKSLMVALPIVTYHTEVLKKHYNDEVEKNRVWWQELRGIFLMGADYYYEL